MTSAVMIDEFTWICYFLDRNKYRFRKYNKLSKNSFEAAKVYHVNRV